MVAALLASCGLLLAGPAAAQGLLLGGDQEQAEGEEQPFDIRADSVELESERDVYVAEGDVVIRQPGRTIRADWVAFSNRTRQGVATGNVVVEEGSDTLYADVLHFEVDELKGIVLDGTLYAGQDGFRLTGSEIRKVGDQEYELDEAEFTTCRCPEDTMRDPWTITAKRADLEFGGYATTRNTTFDVLGVPVIWLPWMRYPLKTERETGFLFPEFGASSRTGFDFGVPFFWAARKNINVLLTPRYLTENGFKPDAEMEYVFGEFSWGQIYGTWVDDQGLDANDAFNGIDRNRWAFEWVHDHYLPEDWRFKVDARFFSDNRYSFDFQDFSRFRNDRYIESLAFAETRFGPADRLGFTGEVRWADDQQNPENADRDDFLRHRLPDLQVAGAPHPLRALPGGLVGSFDTRYTHFWGLDDAADTFGDLRDVDGVFLDSGVDGLPDGFERDRAGNVFRLDGTVDLRSGGTITAAELAAGRPMTSAADLIDASQDDVPGPEGDGAFQEGELLLDRGHRFVLNPRLARPFRVADVVEVYPELGWHGTFYQTDAVGGAARNLFTAMVDARTRLRRVIDIPFVGRGAHLLEPSIAWIGISDDDQDDNPLFIPRPAVLQERQRQLSPTSILRDPSDRIEAVNAVKLALGNRIYVQGREDRPPHLFADASLSFLHDFAEDEISNVVFDGDFWPHDLVRVRTALRWDLDRSDLAEAWFQLRYSSPRGDDFFLTYRKLDDVPRFFENFAFDDDRFEEFEEGFVRISQLDFFSRIAITRNIGVTYRLRYSFEQSLILSNQVGLEYLSRCNCWAVRLEIDDDRSRGFEFGFRYRVFGLGDDTVRPFAGNDGTGRRSGRDALIQDPLADDDL